MHETAGPDPASPVPEPPPLALAIGLELVTRYHLRLIDPRDARLGELGSAYPFGAAAWTGRRAAFVGFYRPPDDPAEAARDLEERRSAALRWGQARLTAQDAERCDILLIASGTVPVPATRPGDSGPVQVGAVAIDGAATAVTVLLPLARGLPGTAELRHHLRSLRDGRPAPTLAAVDLAERQSVAAGYTTPARRALTTRPICTYALIALMAVAFLGEKAVYGHILDGRHYVTSIDLGAVCSGMLIGPHGLVLCGATPDNWWRLVTSDFLHDPDNILHILGNSMALFLIGGLVEQLYGRLVLLGTFVLTAALGDLFWMACAGTGLTSAAPGLGASGGIMGLMGLLVMLGRVQGKNVPVGIAASIRQYAISYSIFVIVLSLFVQNVNNWVHVGGIVAGALVGVVVGPVEAVGGRRLRQVERGVLVAVIAAAVVALGFGIQHTAGILINPPNDLVGIG